MSAPGAFCVFLLIILASSAIPFARTSNAAGQEFLNNNALNDGVAVLPSGLQYRVVVHGSGVETPLPNTSCLLHYEGSLIDGTVFDSSYRRGKVPAPLLMHSTHCSPDALSMLWHACSFTLRCSRVWCSRAP